MPGPQVPDYGAARLHPGYVLAAAWPAPAPIDADEHDHQGGREALRIPT
jgi:hypothetical protein